MLMESLSPGAKCILIFIQNNEFNETESLRLKTFSKLSDVNGETKKAIEELSTAIYMDSLIYGPESTVLVSDYYDLSKLFSKFEDEDPYFNLLRTYEKVDKN